MADSFEYRIHVSGDDDDTDEQTLNSLGGEGWELVNAVADVRADEESESDEDNIPVTVFYMKRRMSA